MIDKDNNHRIPNRALDKIAQDEKKYENNKKMFPIVLTVLLAVIFLNIKSAFNFATDDSYNLYEIEGIDSYSRVVSLRKRSKIPREKWDLVIKQFARDIVTRLYPRTPIEVKPTFEWLFNKTLPKSNAASRYAGYLDDHEDFEHLIDQGTLTSLMPVDNIDQIKVRKVDGQYGHFLVEVPMYKHVKGASRNGLSIATFRIRVVITNTTRERKSAGIFFSDIEGEIYEDYLSNKKRLFIE